MHLSVIVTTYNEADNIVDCLASVPFADEVLVIDSFSTDGTQALAKQSGATVIERKYTGPADQKNWAIPQVSHPWVLILDADERITPALAEEIQHTIAKSSNEYDAYWIGRSNTFMGKRIRFCGWQRDKVIRLIKRDKCLYNNNQVHEEIETKGIRVGQLKEKMRHNTYKSMTHYLDKWNRYTTWSAMDAFQKGKRPSLITLVFKPQWTFFKTFVLQRGFLDGYRGLIICVLAALTVFMRYVKMYDRMRRT